MILKKHSFLLAFCMLISIFGYSQTATLQGVISEMDDFPIGDATISIDKTTQFALSDSFGFYTITIPAGRKVTLSVRALGFETSYFSLTAKDSDLVTKKMKLTSLASEVGGATVRAERSRGQVGTLNISTKNVDQLPSTIGGIEGQLKVLLGSRNELSSQYNVRGGNFDENLVYVNDFEINRPFLVRSGQQEGLSFVNTDLVDRVEFSVGGFQAKYGDKMASVLDVTYKRPEHFSGSFLASFLGFQAHVSAASKNKKLSTMIGFRQKSNQYLLKSQPTKGQYNPSFTDLQALINYRFSEKWELEFIGNYALNKFQFSPESSRTVFGTATQSLAFTALYDGQELDRFDNAFAGLSLNFKPNNRLNIKVLASGFQSFEQETYDISSMFLLSVVENNLGSAGVGKDIYSLGSGEIHKFARNYLLANVANVGLKGAYKSNKHFWSFGANVQHVSIDDRLMEWERRDSAGFSIPYDPNQVNMYKYFKANNSLSYEKLDAYVQNNILLGNKDRTVLTLGLRGTYSFLNKEMLWSPRVNLSFKPELQENMLFKFAMGIYDQPPFYREMRTMEGVLNTQLKAQKSFHVAAGMDYNFVALAERKFKMTSELFYKSLWDLVPYEYDNVRIRYAANNFGKGYAYGGEVRLFGELVKDAESWVSVSYLKTMEQIYDPIKGAYGAWQPRPTDGRVSFGVFFSDYLPQNHNFKVFLNMMYATGLPASLPEQDFVTNGKFRIPDYRRVDIGFSALLLDSQKNPARNYSLFKGVKSMWLSFEVFNLIGSANTLSYEYIQSLNSSYNYFIPNRLTSRLVNLKLAVKF